jgi:hypothetical protein
MRPRPHGARWRERGDSGGGDTERGRVRGCLHEGLICIWKERHHSLPLPRRSSASQPPDNSSSCCFAQCTISLHNRQNNLIFSLATQLSFQSIIPKYIKKKKSPCHISACSVLGFPCQGICKSIALTILSTNYLRMPVMSPTVNALLINNASGSGPAPLSGRSKGDSLLL